MIEIKTGYLWKHYGRWEDDTFLSAAPGAEHIIFWEENYSDPEEGVGSYILTETETEPLINWGKIEPVRREDWDNLIVGEEFPILEADGYAGYTVYVIEHNKDNGETKLLIKS